MSPATAHPFQYWLGVVGGSLLVGCFFGAIALCIGAVVGEVKTARRVFLGLVVAGFFGGLKLIGILFVPSIWPIFEARRRTKLQLAQRGVQANGAESMGAD